MGFNNKRFGDWEKDGGIKDVFGASPNMNLQYNRLQGCNGITETSIRTANTTYSYVGSIINVPADHATISAAIAAASSGDIIQIADGTYLTSAESAGYLLINDTKNLLIRGNASDNTAVKISQNAVSGFGVRIRKSGNVTFQDLTITSNQAANAVYQQFRDTGSSPTKVICDNCIIENTAASTATTIIVSAVANVCYTEFNECVLTANSSSGSYVIDFSVISDAQKAANAAPILITESTINGEVRCGDSAIDLTMYNNTLTQSFYDSSYILSIGSDTTAPTNSASVLDIRGNTFQYVGFCGHAVLLGRGTKDIYMVNNTINIPASTNVLALGIVMKSIAAIVGDVIVSGNIVTAPRPLYIKGGQNCKVQYNCGVSNWDDLTFGYGFEVNNPDNPDGVINSTGNIVTNNSLIGKIGGIALSKDAAAGSPKTSVLTGNFDYNTYQVLTGNTYVDNEGIPVLWSGRDAFWSLDKNSQFIEL